MPLQPFDNRRRAVLVPANIQEGATIEVKARNVYFCMKSCFELIAQALYFGLTREFRINHKPHRIILNRIHLHAFAHFERKDDLSPTVLIY